MIRLMSWISGMSTSPACLVARNWYTFSASGGVSPQPTARSRSMRCMKST
jgi:hypothetical protein